jgi:hypothetical protein
MRLAQDRVEISVFIFALLTFLVLLPELLGYIISSPSRENAQFSRIIMLLSLRFGDQSFYYIAVLLSPIIC